jgi:serine/threonine protein kinase
MTNQSNEHLAIGYKIGGHYKIIKVLGQGGFGIVYLVEDIHRLNALFVIKELFSRDFSFRHRDGQSVYNKAEAKEIFAKIKDDIISEVNILQKIRDKNIVEAYGYFEDNNTLYSVMEFIDGVDLDKYLKRVPPFTEDEAKDLLLQISSGIEKIHDINILHRDIKPSNIMRTKDGIYKLIDFTTNRTYVDNQLTTVTAFQSPIYTPPELSGNQKAIIGKFSDIYSIGMTICRVLAEDEETLPNITDRLINDNEFQTTIDRLDIDDNFKGILRKMTEIAPEDRFQDLKDIEKLLNSNQITQPSNKEIKEEPKKESSKSKSWFNIIALVLSITLLGLGGYAYKIIKDNKENTKTVQQKTQIEVSTIDKKDKAEEEEIKQEIKPLSIPELSEDEVEKEKRVEEDSKIKEDESIEIVATPKPTLIPKNPNTISLGTMIQAGTLPPLSDKKYTPISNRGEIRNFLLAFMKSSEGNSITNLLSYYDYHIDKYFSWRNITHRDIYRDKLRYNKKWVQREFKLISFDILNKYQKNGIEYFNIQKTIQYRVVSANGKIAKGTSKVRMTLKYTNNGFKVTSIYSIK